MTTFRLWLFVLAALALLSLGMGIVLAQPPSACAPWEVIRNGLNERYGETVAGFGLAVEGHLTALFLNEETRTWSVIIFRPDGLGCMVESGESWQPPTEAMRPGVDS
jgi:hypothetical protein